MTSDIRDDGNSRYARKLGGVAECWGRNMTTDDYEARLTLRRASWASGITLDALNDEDMRGIIRAHFADTAMSKTALAREIGITARRLDLFLGGAAATGRAFLRLNAWATGRPTPPTSPEAVALAVLLRWIRDADASAARSQVARCVLDLFSRTKASVPPHVLHALEECL